MPKVPHCNSIYLELYVPKIFEMFVYKDTETIEYVKKWPTF